MTYAESIAQYHWQVNHLVPSNPFEIKEQIGRKYIDDLQLKNPEVILLSGTSIQDKLHYDVLLRLRNYHFYIVGEIKVRNAYITDWQDWMLEDYKINKMNEICQVLNQNREQQNKPLFIPALINITSKDQIVSIYDLTGKAKSEIKNCRANNQSFDYRQKKVIYFNNKNLIAQYQL